MTVEISLENLIRVHKLAALGKLMAGLIHNLNGPLQNIGIDIEMMTHILMEKTSEDKDPEDIFGPRLRRMEGEFDAVNQLIRTVSMKANMEHDSYGYRNLNDFLDEEFSFLKANLYFKHNVRKEFDLEDDLPAITRFGEGVPLGLTWFIQALVEELEREKITNLSMTARSNEKIVELIFDVEAADLPESFSRAVDLEVSPTRAIRIEDRDVGMTLAVALLKQAGASIVVKAPSSRKQIHLSLPLIGGEGFH